MLQTIKTIQSIDGLNITCIFNNNEFRKIDFKKWLLSKNLKEHSILFELLNISYFNLVTLDSYGTLSWPNGVDFCPDVLYSISEVVEEN
jgi:hypothetical protein